MGWGETKKQGGKTNPAWTRFVQHKQNRYRRTFWPRRIFRTTTITTTASWPVAMIPLPLLLLVPSPLFLFPSLSSVWSTSPAINHTGSRSGSLFFMFLSHGQWAVDHGWSELLFFLRSYSAFIFCSFLSFSLWSGYVSIEKGERRERVGGDGRQDKTREGKGGK